jgi:hypothetical protein
MNETPSLSREEVAAQLWRWLPAVVRARDEEWATVRATEDGTTPGVGPLRVWLGLVADELWRLRQLAGQQYDDHFIDSAQDWAIAYLADLVGTSALFTGDAARLRDVAARNREDVKNTIRRRRRKGSLQALEGAAADAGGFGLVAAEMLQRVAGTNHLALPGLAGRADRAADPFTLDLRQREDLATLNTAFDRQRALTDLRAAGDDGRARGWHQLQRLMLFAWPLASAAWQGVSPAGDGARPFLRYHFHPLGRDTALLAGGATDALRERVAALPGAAGADILRPQAHDMPIRPADLRAHAAAYVGSGLGFDLREDGISLLGGADAAAAAPAVRPATGFGELARGRGLAIADRGLYAANTLAEVAVVRLGAVLNNAFNPPQPVVYSPGAAFASQLRLRAAAGRVTVDVAANDFGYAAGGAPYEPAGGAWHHPVLLLRVANRGAAALAWPEGEVIVRDATGRALQVTLPALGALAAGAEQHFYIAEDGSSFHARADHAAGDPDLNPDSLLFGAYTLAHLAAASIGQRRARPGRPAGAARWRRLVVRPLCCWEQPLFPALQPGDLALDPERGRFAFANGEAPRGELTVDFRHGAATPLGAGPYARRPLPTNLRRLTVAKRRNADFQTIQAALNAAGNGFGVPQLIEVLDSATYDEALLIDNRQFPAGLTLRAAPGQVPVVQRAQPLRVQNSTISTLAIEGLVLAGGAVVVTGALARLTLTQVTLDALTTPLQLLSAGPIELQASACLLGAVGCTAAGSVLGFSDCVLHDPAALPEAPEAGSAVTAAGADLAFARCTVLGSVAGRTVSLSNTLLTGALTVADAAAQAMHGCVRYSRLPGSYAGQALRCTTATPLFVSLHPQAHGYAQLHAQAAAVLRSGGEEGGEIGAGAGAGTPWRAAGARTRMAEYTPAGTRSALAWVMPTRPRGG